MNGKLTITTKPMYVGPAQKKVPAPLPSHQSHNNNCDHPTVPAPSSNPCIQKQSHIQLVGIPCGVGILCDCLPDLGFLHSTQCGVPKSHSREETLFAWSGLELTCTCAATPCNTFAMLMMVSSAVIHTPISAGRASPPAGAAVCAANETRWLPRSRRKGEGCGRSQPSPYQSENCGESRGRSRTPTPHACPNSPFCSQDTNHS